MGWCSGTELFEKVWEATRAYVPTGCHSELCAKIVEAFQEEDWDCESDVNRPEWPEFTAALALLERRHAELRKRSPRVDGER